LFVISLVYLQLQRVESGKGRERKDKRITKEIIRGEGQKGRERKEERRGK